MQAPDTSIAQALDYAGFSTVMLADYLCQAPLNGGPALDPPVVYDSAITLFQETVQRAGGATFLTNLANVGIARSYLRSEEHTSELQSQSNLVCRLLLEKKNTQSALAW